MRGALAVTTCLWLGSCATPGVPVGPLDLAVVRALEEQASDDALFRRLRARFSLETDDLSLDGTAVAIVSTTGPPRVSMQLIPPVGTKVLDLRIGPDPQGDAVLDATWPQAGRDLTIPFDAESPAGLELFIACTLLEAVAPVQEARVTGMGRRGDGHLAALVGRAPGVTVVLEIDADGSVSGRRFARGPVRWTERRAGADRVIEGRGLRLALSGESVQPLEDAPAALFTRTGP